MAKTKTKKSSLVASIISLVACVALLIATTFAWFTSTASTSVNKIQAGTLEVALEMYDEGQSQWVSAEGKTLSFKKAAGGASEAVLWEPGCTYELPKLRVVNEGNLALKYKIQITGIDGDAKLNEAIEWTISDENLSADHNLKAGATSEDLTIKGHMKENAGNEYQGLSIDGISITVVATQLSAEYDSTSNTYDASSQYPVSASAKVSLNASADESATTATLSKEISIKSVDKVTEEGTSQGEPLVSAVVPKDVVVEKGTKELVLKVTEATTPANVTIKNSNESKTLEVKLDGLAKTNQTIIKVDVFIGKNIPITELIHTENNTATTMTKVDSKSELDAHNEYYYDSDTGFVTMALKSFSPFTYVIETPLATVTAADGKVTDYLSTTKYEMPEQLGNDGSTWSAEYKALTRAFFDVAQTGGTIVINKDLTFGESDNGGLNSLGECQMSEDKWGKLKKDASVKNVVLDFAGNTLNFNYVKSGGWDIVLGNINVTLKDSSAAKTGGINSKNYFIMSSYGNSTINIESGIYLTDYKDSDSSPLGTAVVKGGDYVYDDDADKLVEGIVNITGGTFSYVGDTNKTVEERRQLFIKNFNVPSDCTCAFDSYNCIMKVTKNS